MALQSILCKKEIHRSLTQWPPIKQDMNRRYEMVSLCSKQVLGTSGGGGGEEVQDQPAFVCCYGL